MQASKELWEHVLLLSRTDKESFEGGGKNRYVHKGLRSAYKSLKTKLPWLFTWYDNMHSKIPNTTNAIDGHFANLKNKLRNHNGLSKARKKKFLEAITSKTA